MSGSQSLLNEANNFFCKFDVNVLGIDVGETSVMELHNNAVATGF